MKHKHAMSNGRPNNSTFHTICRPTEVFWSRRLAIGQSRPTTSSTTLSPSRFRSHGAVFGAGPRYITGHANGSVVVLPSYRRCLAFHSNPKHAHKPKAITFRADVKAYACARSRR